MSRIEINVYKYKCPWPVHVVNRSFGPLSPPYFSNFLRSSIDVDWLVESFFEIKSYGKSMDLKPGLNSGHGLEYLLDHCYSEIGCIENCSIFCCIQILELSSRNYCNSAKGILLTYGSIMPSDNITIIIKALIIINCIVFSSSFVNCLMTGFCIFSLLRS